MTNLRDRGHLWLIMLVEVQRYLNLYFYLITFNTCQLQGYDYMKQLKLTARDANVHCLSKDISISADARLYMLITFYSHLCQI